MKILVTGGAGFIGSAVVRLAVTRGHAIVNLDALTYAACLDNVASVADSPLYAFEHADIRDRAALDRILATHRPDAIFIDQGNMGLGVVDRCRQLQLPVFGIDFGSDPDSGDPSAAYYNKRAEMWGKLRDWLPHGMIDDDAELKVNLTAVEYGYKLRNGRDCILLERKKDMKARGLASPDDADALALTFAHPVAPSDHTAQLSHRPRHQVEYDPFASLYGKQR